MRKAITVRVIPANITRPTRLVASAPENGRRYARYQFDGMEKEAQELAERYACDKGWAGRWIGAGLGDGWVFVNVEDDDGFTVEL